MRLVIQRVKSASVSVDGGKPRAIAAGLCVLFGVAEGDSLDVIPKLAEKTARLRIFSDDGGKMNLCASDIGGGVLVVPNFTLFADTKKGNRPSFIAAAQPGFASEAFDRYLAELKKYEWGALAAGEFGADMLVTIANDGPITIIMDTEEWSK